MSKIEIINYFDNLINRVDIDIEESLEKYNEEQVIGDLKCYKSFKKKEEKENNFEINKPYKNEPKWLELAKGIEERCEKSNETNENPDDIEYNKIFKTVDLWSEETKVIDYLNQVRMRTIEELREAQKEALESYKSQSDDSKSQLYPDKFYFQVRYKKSKPDEWIFKLFTFDTDFYLLPDDIDLFEQFINGEEYMKVVLFRDSMKIFNEKMVLIRLLEKHFFENLNSEKFPSHVISVRKRDLFAIKQIDFDYSVDEVNLKCSSIDLSYLESLDISKNYRHSRINIDGLSSLLLSNLLVCV